MLVVVIFLGGCSSFSTRTVIEPRTAKSSTTLSHQYPIAKVLGIKDIDYGFEISQELEGYEEEVLREEQEEEAKVEITRAKKRFIFYVEEVAKEASKFLIWLFTILLAAMSLLIFYKVFTIVNFLLESLYLKIKELLWRVKK